jgi:hypothetical protein
MIDVRWMDVGVVGMIMDYDRIHIIIVVMGTEDWSLGFFLFKVFFFTLLFGIHWLFCVVFSWDSSAF